MNTESRRNFPRIRAVVSHRPQTRTDLQFTRKAREVAQLADTFSFTFFSPRDEFQQPFPNITINVEQLGVKSPTDIKKQVTSQGEVYQITINEKWMARSTRWEIAEVLLHQMLITSFATWSNRNIRTTTDYHVQPLIGMAEELGLHLEPFYGRHLKPADGQFEKLMAILGIDKPNITMQDQVLSPKGKTKGVKHWWDNSREPVKGNSTNKKFVCGCGGIRSGKADLNSGCFDCGQMYRLDGSNEPPRYIDMAFKPEPKRPHLDKINGLFTSKARTTLLQTFFSNPDVELHVRGLVRRTGLEINAVRRELAKFEEMGLVRSHQEQNRRVYSLEKESDEVVALSYFFPAKID